MPTAHEDNFVGSDRRLSYVQDRATFHDFSQGAAEQTKNPLDVAIDGNGFLVVQTPGGERYTRDGNLQLNNQGQLVTAAGNPVLGSSGPIVLQPTDHDINITADGTITVVEGSRPHRFGARQAAAGQLSRSAEDTEGRLRTSMRRAKASPQPDTKSTLRQGFIEKSNVNAVAEMSRMIEVTRAYTQIATLLQQQSDLHKSAIEKLADVPA